MKYITKICIFLSIFLFPFLSVSAIEQNTDSLQQAQGSFMFDKIIIAIGLFVVISAAFFNWESRTKKKKKVDTDLQD
jgi:hypothetical protein